MTRSHFESTIDDLISAINKYLKTEISNENIGDIKTLCELLKNFPETLFQFLNNVILISDKITSQNKLLILEFIDGKKDSLNILLNEETLIKKLKLYEEVKQFDNIIDHIKRYNLDKNILNLSFKEDILILILRVYAKENLFDSIIDLKSRTEAYIEQFNFDSNQKNRYYNYLARAFAYMRTDNSEAIKFLDLANQITNTVEIEIRNFRYTTLCYWKIEGKNCIEKAKEGINFITNLNKTEEYKKYYSDLYRLLSAALINKGDLNSAFTASKCALKIIADEDYYYEKFWIDFQQCSILRKLGKNQAALKKISQMEITQNYQKTINNHPEAKYKLETEKLKISICEKKNLIAVITILLSDSYQVHVKNSWEKFYRYLMLAEAYHYRHFKQEAQEYLGAAKVFNNENKKEYLKVNKFIEIQTLVNYE